MGREKDIVKTEPGTKKMTEKIVTAPTKPLLKSCSRDDYRTFVDKFEKYKATTGVSFSEDFVSTRASMEWLVMKPTSCTDDIFIGLRNYYTPSNWTELEREVRKALEKGLDSSEKIR
ncbi:hypothetical protein ADUPG1_000676, partial [Aduncisulcus paluster]